MGITKETNVDQITVVENGAISYREITRIIEDGNVLTQSYHRTSLVPGQDLTGHPDKVKAIAEITWTKEVVDAYQAHIKSIEFKY